MSWSRNHESQARAIVEGDMQATPAQLRALLMACLDELDKVRGTVMQKRQRQGRLL